MTNTERKNLVKLGAAALSNPELANAITSRGWRKIMLAINEDMGRTSEPSILVDDLLDELGVRWIPEAT